jgi:integrase
MLSLAVKDWGLRLDNPCLGLKKFPERKRERFFNDDDLKRIGAALADVEREESEFAAFPLLVRLLATTGMRLGEALQLEWSHIDLAARSIRLADAKAGARTVHLGVGAVAILAAVDDKKGFVIHSGNPEYPASRNLAEKAWSRLRTAAGIGDGRLHDLRHTAGTVAAIAGANAFAIRDLLGHRTLAMTGRYVERAADIVRNTADVVAERIATAMSASEATTAQVVEIAARR